MTWSSRMASIAVVQLAIAGCASTYHPMVTPRVQVIQRTGGLALLRSGNEYNVGLFGGGLSEAVSGVPEAESYARSFERLQLGGFFFTLGGIGSTLASIPVANAESRRARDADRYPNYEVTTGILLGGAALSLIGIACYASSGPDFWDAINSYNDGIQRAAIEKWRRSRGE